MNSFKRVKAAINFTGPDRIPRFKSLFDDIMPITLFPSKSWHPGYTEYEKDCFPFYNPELFRFMHRWNRPEWAKVEAFKRYKWLKLPHLAVNEHGTKYELSGKGDTLGHPVNIGPIDDYTKIDWYKKTYCPDYSDDSRVRFRRSYKFYTSLMKKYRLGILSSYGPFQIAQEIRGFQNFITDPYKHPEELKDLIDYLKPFFIAQIKKIKDAYDVHGIFLYDDLATQDRPFFRPKFFKKFFEDIYRTFCDTAHDLGCEFFLHTCGNNIKILPDLIEWGVDGFEFDSPRMNDYSELRKFRGKTVFWGCVNIQTIYVNGTPEECKREVWHMMNNMGTKDGGFIAYFYPQPSHILAPRTNIKAFSAGLRKYGVYDKIPTSWWNEPTPEEWSGVPPLPI
jgi:Uroporphyrinogen decarboxylase (URO-D)